MTLIFDWTPYALPFLAAGTMLGSLAAYVMSRRDTVLGPPFALLLSAVSAWLLLEGLIVLGSDLETKVRVARACYPAIVLIGPSIIAVGARANDSSWRPGWAFALWALPIPLLTVPISLLHEIPGLLYLDASLDLTAPYPRRVFVRGVWYYVVVAHIYFSVAYSSLLLLRRVFASRRDRAAEGALILAGIVTPWIFTTVRVIGLEPLPYIDITPFGFVFSAVLLWWGFRSSGLIGLMRVGRKVVLEAMSEGVVVTDCRGHLVELNHAARRLLDLGGLEPAGQPIQSVLAEHPEVVRALLAADESDPGARDHEWLGSGRAVGEIRLRCDGEERFADMHLAPLHDRLGGEVHRVIVLRDVTERRRAQAELARESSYIQLIQEVALAANEAATMESSLETAVRYICQRMGWTVGHVYLPSDDGLPELVEAGIRYSELDLDLEQLFHHPDVARVKIGAGLPGWVCETGRPLLISDIRGDPRRLEDPRLALAEEYGWTAVMCLPVTVGQEVAALLEFASGGEVEDREATLSILAHLGSLLGRVIERKRSEDEIRRLAFFDPLTGLANRRLFREKLHSALEEAGRFGRTAALLFIDLDNFKLINDTLGHGAGDVLLRRVSDRFVRCVRKSDMISRVRGEEQLLISRLGGDEFTVLLRNIASIQDAAMVARRLIQALAAPFYIEHSEVFSGASVGIAIYPDDGDTADTLLQNADVAMYEAKKGGANRLQFYAEAMNRESRRQLDMEAKLRRVLERGGLRIHYQPQLETATGRIIAAEALLRWPDPEEGWIAPAEFIPVAERSGLIGVIGAWVLQEVCQQARQWQVMGYRPIRIAVNVSGHQLRSGDFVEIVRRTLLGTELDASDLEIELTESAIASEDRVTHDAIAALREMGVTLSLDDFGTGSSSLTHLRVFPMQHVKIDRAFVSGVCDDSDDASLTAAIIAMAHSLRRTVVAEGVESEEQAAFLTARGCDILQGYLIGHPVSAPEFIRFLELDDKLVGGEAPSAAEDDESA